MGEGPSPPTPLPELKRQLGQMYDAWLRDEKGLRISLGLIGPEEAARIKAVTGLDTLLNRRELKTSWIDHAFKRHEVEKTPGQISITKEDFERYAEILTDPHWIEPAPQPNSFRYLRRYADGTVYVMEHQIKGKKLEFRTLWKQALGGAMVPILIGELEKDGTER